MATVVTLRTGRVTYLAGTERNRFRTGESPVYAEARVEEWRFEGDPEVYYSWYPNHHGCLVGPDGATLPERLLPEVRWDA